MFTYILTMHRLLMRTWMDLGEKYSANNFVKKYFLPGKLTDIDTMLMLMQIQNKIFILDGLKIKQKQVGIYE